MPTLSDLLPKSGALFLLIYLAGYPALHADVKLPAIFGDHMVLQQDAKLPVWGTADPGEAVTVSLGDHTAHATAAADGKWQAELPPVSAGTAPLTLTVAGKNTLKFEDVLAGDVWVCSGQSNMEFGLAGAHNHETELPKANDPQLRLFLVTKNAAHLPASDVTGHWELCTPETAARFTAVGYFFGRDLREKLQRPIGLIGTYWGGTPAEAWTSVSGLQKEPTLSYMVDQWNKLDAGYAKAAADYPALKSAYDAENKQWNDQYGKDFAAKMAEWKQEADRATHAGQSQPPRPVPPVPQPKAPETAEGGSHAPATLFNGMIAPLVPYAIKGAIWYQGESNAGKANEYHVLFSRMITDWREKWGQGDFPFLFVQLAGYNPGKSESWPRLREAQLQTLALPKTGMATAVDIGLPGNIHPMDKMDVGHRLALAAFHVAYGEKLVYSGPIYDSMEKRAHALAVAFSHPGTGLKIGSSPWVGPGATAAPTDHLVGFVIANVDKNWIPADAKISGDSVIVSSPQVPDPVAVRYAWESYPVANLYNKQDLPASPFRTDDWPENPGKPAQAPPPAPKP